MVSVGGVQLNVESPCERLARKSEQALRRGARHMKLSTAMDKFLTDTRMRGLATATLQAYESDLKLLVSLATVHAADSGLALTPDLGRPHFMTLSKKGLTMSTLSRRRATINEFGRWGARQRYWERSPVEDLPKRHHARHARRAGDSPAARGRGARSACCRPKIKKPPRPLPRPFTE